MQTVALTRSSLSLAKLAIVLGFVVLGLAAETPPAAFYWLGVTLLALVWLGARPIQLTLARWRFHAQMRALLAPAGRMQDRLVAAADEIKRNHEDRALRLLKNVSQRCRSSQVLGARRWLRALASAHWMARQRPPRPLAPFQVRFPQLHAVAFSYGAATILHPQALAYELTTVSATDLDALAEEYIDLLDLLVASLRRSGAPFSDEAEELLSFLTGHSHLVNARERYAAWWRQVRPAFQRGGGAFLVSSRLLQRELYGEAAELLDRLAEDGLLSRETETIRRAAEFMALFAGPQWRMTAGDIPTYFAQGQYYLAREMGLLRYPTAELPEVVSCCRRGKLLRANKRQLIEDTLALWEMFQDDLALPLATLLKRLLEHKGRNTPLRLNFWQDHWQERQADFEQPVAFLMQGIAASDAGDWRKAERCFHQAAQLEPESSLALVNLARLYMVSEREEQARWLIARIREDWSRDGPAFTSLGRLAALHLHDTALAEELFRQALGCTDSAAEVLVCLGEIKLLDGLHLESLSYFEQARQADPTLPDAKLGLARVQLELRNFSAAIESLESAVRDGPEEARHMAWYLLYRVYREMGSDRRAVEYLDLIPDRFFREPDILDDIAVHLEGEQLYAKARHFAERAMLLRANGPNLEESDTLDTV